MSCRPCKDAQDGLTETSSYYFRWGNAIIELRGCKMHIAEVMDCLRESFREKQREADKEQAEEIRKMRSST